jgi:hypothetical protein
MPSKSASRLQVIHRLAVKYIPEKLKPRPPRKNDHCLSAQHGSTVVEFLERDDISRMAPGMRDFVRVPVEGVKNCEQMRYLNCSLRETFHLFREEYREIRMSLSLFCSLRRQHILTFGQIPHEICLCQIHEDFIE